MMYHVYTFTFKDVMYIGLTKRLSEREKEHIRNIQTKNTAIYCKLRELNCKYIALSVQKSFKNKADAKRYEMYLILERYFAGLPLYQSIPKIF